MRPASTGKRPRRSVRGSSWELATRSPVGVTNGEGAGQRIVDDAVSSRHVRAGETEGMTGSFVAAVYDRRILQVPTFTAVIDRRYRHLANYFAAGDGAALGAAPLMSRSSTSKISVEFGGMPAPGERSP